MLPEKTHPIAQCLEDAHGALAKLTMTRSGSGDTNAAVRKALELCGATPAEIESLRACRLASDEWQRILPDGAQFKAHRDLGFVRLEGMGRTGPRPLLQLMVSNAEDAGIPLPPAVGA